MLNLFFLSDSDFFRSVSSQWQWLLLICLFSVIVTMLDSSLLDDSDSVKLISSQWQWLDCILTVEQICTVSYIWTVFRQLLDSYWLKTVDQWHSIKFFYKLFYITVKMFLWCSLSYSSSNFYSDFSVQFKSLYAEQTVQEKQRGSKAAVG